MAFSPDGKTLAAGYGTRLVLFDAATRKPLGEHIDVKEGPVQLRGLQPRRKDPGGWLSAAPRVGSFCATWTRTSFWRTDLSPSRRGPCFAWPSATTAKLWPLGLVAPTMAESCCGTWPRAGGWVTKLSPPSRRALSLAWPLAPTARLWPLVTAGTTDAMSVRSYCGT